MGGNHSHHVEYHQPTVFHVVDEKANLINAAAGKLGLDRSKVNIAVTGQTRTGK